MNLLIFGAAGKTGHELVRQALAQGHAVSAFVRNPSKLSVTHENLKIVQGDVKDYSSIESAIKGHDAVLSALGVSKPLKRDPIVVEGVGHIVKAMEQQGMKRFIYLSATAVSESRKESGFLIRHLVSKIARNELADHEEKERIVRSSRLDWTIVRAPALTNGPQTGVYRSGETIIANSLLPKMSRADVAEFMLKQLTTDAFVRKVVRIMP